MAPKSSSTAKKTSGPQSEQAEGSRRIRKRPQVSESSPTMKKREYFDEKVETAHRIKHLYDNLKSRDGAYTSVSKFLNTYRFSSEEEYLNYLNKSLRTVIPGDDDTCLWR